MSPHTVQYCARCGRAFRKDQTRYLVSIQVVADFDGTLSPAGRGGERRRMWKEIEAKTEEELTNEVAQKLSFTLCKPCRDVWVAAPLGEEAAEDGPDAGRMH